MKKITLVLFFCFCAVGFSQAQAISESSGTATTNDSKSVFRSITAPAVVQSKTANVVALTGKSSELERSLAAPMRIQSQSTEVKNERSAGPQNVSAEYGARVSANGSQQSQMFRLNSEPGYIARTSAGDYTAPTSNTRMANLLEEGFDDITTLAGAGWTSVNASDVIGTTDWAQGSTTVFDSQTGAADSYMSGNYNNTAGSIINNWMITPVLNLENGDEITFWTRTGTGSNWPDRLELRLSPDGTATAPASPTDVGSYTELLLEVNPALTTGGYPEVWTEFTAVVSGLTGAVNTSVAFRYFVTDAGPTGTNSNYIGIDTLSIDEATGGGPVFPAPYCGPIVFTSTVEPMTLVDVAGISNVTDPATGGVAHEDFTAMVGSMEEGMTYPIALEGNTDGGFTNRFAVFIDWNQNDVLDDAGEVYEIIETINGSTGTDGMQATGMIVVPAGVTAGDTRMRVKKIFGTTNYLDPCLGTGFGQVEDYTITVTAGGGGGGGMACSQENPLSAAPGGGMGSSVDSDFKTASDIVVAAGEDFTIDSIDAYFLTFAPADPPTTATVMYYADAGGLPGAMIGSETVVPTILSAQPWANPVADQYETTMAVTPFTFAGDAGSDTTYWIEISMGTATNQATVFWEFTNDTPVVGNSAVQFDGSAGLWSVPDPLQETVYNYSGECTPMGGGGMACNQENPLSAAPGGGMGSSVDSDFKTASDIVVAAGEDFTIDSIDAYFLTFAPADPPTTATVMYYADAGGLPGAMIGSETVVPTILSAQPWANPVADQYETTMAVTPFTFAGDAGSDTTYWIEISMGTATNQATVFWEFTNDTPVVGNSAVQFDGSAGLWSVPDPLQETVYNYSGECTPMGGGPADNDTCADATAIACGDTVISDTLTNTDTGGNPAADEWFKFTGTGTPELVTISLCDGGTDYDSLLRVFSDCTLANEIATNDDSCGLQSELLFASDGTSTYYIMVEGFDTSAGNFSLAVTCSQAPINDNCDGALPIACGEIVAGSTDNATEDSAVAPECDTTVTAPGVWYVYEDTTGLITDITITMCNGTTDYDSKLSVYTGDCAAPPFTCVVGNDDTCGLQSEVSFQSDGATTFYILVHGFGGGTGNFEIEMTCTLVPPPNDMIANSIDVDEVGFPYTDPSVATPAATFEAGSPVNCNNSGARGVWYNFVAEGDGTATASITTPGEGGLLFTVNNGPLAGSYDAIAAAFGGEFTTTAITSDTVVILDDDSTGDPNDACDAILNGADLSGKIAIARRGACAFTDKVLAAQNAGAIAVIVVNNQPGGPIVMGGANPDVTIPALMLGDVDGEAIIAEVLGGGTLNATMGLESAGFSAVTFYTAPNETAVETDLVLVDWFQNQCLPGTTASINTVAGQAYYVYVANHDAITDIVIDGTNLGTEDNTIEGFTYYPNPAESTLNLSSLDIIESVAI
ncbi:MAG: hypothetical protein ACI884_000687, partial [Ulvibacter sp.]